MDNLTQEVVAAIKAALDEHYEQLPISLAVLIDISDAAIKASGAEHLVELVRALEMISNARPDKIITNPKFDCSDSGVLHRVQQAAEHALSKLPPKLRGG
jgi:hypothetical protein